MVSKIPLSSSTI